MCLVRGVPGEGSIRFLSSVSFTTTGFSDIDSIGNFTIRLQQANAGTGLVNTLDFRNETDDRVAVEWGSGNTRTFANAITIIGGTHGNFPTDWTNGLTFGGASVHIARPGSGTTLNWANVEIPDGTIVTFPGTTALSIAGLTAAEQTRVSGNNIT